MSHLPHEDLLSVILVCLGVSLCVLVPLQVWLRAERAKERAYARVNGWVRR